jgi:hypothetical protein
MRLGVLGEPAMDGEARHRRQERQVNAAGQGKVVGLTWEICPGVGPAVDVAAPTACIVRCGLAGQKSAEVVVPVRGTDDQPGRTERQAELRNRCCSCRPLCSQPPRMRGPAGAGDGEFQGRSRC